VCLVVPFVEIARWAAAIEASGGPRPALCEAQDAFGCGQGCGLCRRYVRRVLETGETRFRVDA